MVGRTAAFAVAGRLGPAAEELPDALLHFARGLVGERHRQDVAGRHALFDQMRDADGDDARLARARARQDQDRALRWSRRPGVAVD